MFFAKKVAELRLIVVQEDITTYSQRKVIILSAIIKFKSRRATVYR